MSEIQPELNRRNTESAFQALRRLEELHIELEGKVKKLQGTVQQTLQEMGELRQMVNIAKANHTGTGATKK